jgi:hypothetical protein
MKHARVALVLAVASGISAALLFPYLLVLVPKLGTSPLPLWLLVVIQAGQAGVLGFGLAWVGLRLGAPLGLDAPLLRRWLYPPAAKPRTRLSLAATVGVGIGVFLVLLDRLVFMPLQPDVIRELGAQIVPWKGLLASFYGGIAEEVQTRLFVMSIAAWLFCKVVRRPGPAVFVTAALVSAAALALLHLPTAAQLAPLSGPVVTRVLVLNTAAGVSFGTLFWRHGLEHAMLAHFCADLVVHVVAPLGP